MNTKNIKAMKKYLILSAIAVLALGACSKNDINEDAGRNNAIGFNSYTSRSLTKADPDYFVNAANFTGITNPAIGVYAYRIPKPGNFAGTENAAFMENIKVTLKNNGDDASINYTPLRYWPKNGDKITFFSYYPYNGAGITLTNAGKSGLGKFTFAVQANAADQIDFMVADAKPDMTFSTADVVSGENGVVKFMFKHMLSQVRFYVQTAKDYSDASYDNTTITLNALTLKNVKKSGDLAATYSSPSTTTAWQNLGTKGDFEVVSSDVTLSTTPQLCADGAVASTAKEGIYLMIPQDLAFAPDTVKVYIKYTIKTGTHPDTATDTYEETIPIRTTEVEEWSKNNNIKYTFKIGPQPIQFAAVVTEWEDETDVPFTIN